MDQQTDYNYIVGIVERMDGSTEGQKSIIIDSNEALIDRISVKSYDYEKACKIIEGIESPIPIEQQASAMPKPQIQMPNVDKGKEIVIDKSNQIKQKISNIEIQKKVFLISRNVFDAAKEIEGIVGKMENDVEENLKNDIFKAPTKKLVLPTLSIQDQINELGGILEGLGSKSFDQQKVAVIKEEIDGLEALEKKGKKEKEQDVPPELIEIRQKLLLDIRNKLLSINN